MGTMDEEKRKQIWMKFLNDFYSGMPRMKSQLESSDLIANEQGCGIRIPIYKEQEELLEKGLVEGLFIRLKKLKYTLAQFHEEFPGLENLSFSLKLRDGSIIKLEEMESLENNSDNSEDDNSVKFCNTLTIDEDLPDDSNTIIAKSFAEALCSDDFETIATLLNDDARMISYRKRTISGKDAFVEYWKWLSNLLRIEHKVTDYHLKYNAFIERTVISIRQRDYYQKSTDEAYIFLYLKNHRISVAVVTPRQQQPITIRYYDLDMPALNYEDVMKNKKDVLAAEPNRMPCLHCGRLSEDLEWYNLYVDSGPFGHIGQVSVCPHCKKQVEFYPEIFLRQS